MAETTTTFWSDLLEVVEDEPIEAVVIGRESWGDHADDIAADKLMVPLTADEAGPLLSYAYDTGYGGTDCHPVYVYTPTRVVFVSQYDGSTHVTSLPRHPTVGVNPEMPGGG